MKVTVKHMENVVVFSIGGDVDATNGPELAQLFQAEMVEAVNFVADFTRVDFISSAGLRVLLATVKEARRRGGDLRLAATQASVDKVLTISGFTRIIKTYKTVDDAIESYSE